MKTRHIFLGLMILLGCISCSDDDPQPQELTKGDITGQVKLWNEGQTPLGNEDMTVRIDELDLAATTDLEGKFTLPNVPFGKYDLVYEKVNYGTFKEIGRMHSAYNFKLASETINLGQVSPTRVTGLSVELIGTEIVITVTTEPKGSEGNEQYVSIYYSNSPGYFDFDNHENGAFFKMIISHSGTETITIPMENILAPGGFGDIFFSGDEIFFKAFGESHWANVYYDPKLEMTVHPNLNPSSVDAVSIIVP